MADIAKNKENEVMTAITARKRGEGRQPRVREKLNREIERGERRGEGQQPRVTEKLKSNDGSQSPTDRRVCADMPQHHLAVELTGSHHHHPPPPEQAPLISLEESAPLNTIEKWAPKYLVGIIVETPVTTTCQSQPGAVLPPGVQLRSRSKLWPTASCLFISPCFPGS